jgi:hypothetical protein
MADSSQARSSWRLAPPPDTRSGSSRRLRVFVLAAGVLALTGALLAWLCYPEPYHPPHFLPLCLGEYGEEWPVRGWVRQDGELLRGLGWQEKSAFTSQKRDLLLAELRTFTGRKSSGPVVVYLSAYVLPDPHGELCLLPVDARLDRPDTWLPLRDVFGLLRSCPAPHKLLLLDVMQPLLDARHGLLVNDAADRLQPLLDAVLPQDPRLSVLCACGPGQVSVVLEELGHSLFAHSLWLGLRGEADGAGQSRDGRVSLQELANFVTSHVEERAQRARNVRQTPRLHGCRDDFPLTAANASSAPADASPLDEGYPEWLSAGWKLRDAWWEDETYRLAPEVFLRWEAALRRAEDEWRGGVGAERSRPDLESRRTWLERRRSERLPPVPTAEPASLAEAMARGHKLADIASAATVRDVQRLAARSARAATGKPDDPEAKKIEAEVDPLLKKFEGKPLELAWVILEAALAERGTPETFRFLTGLLQKARVPLYAELRLLGRLAELPVAPPEPWPAEAAQLMLHGVRVAEKVTAADPRALPWVSDSRAAAMRLLREGEELLFSQAPDARGRAREPLQAAGKAFQAIDRDLRTVEQAQRCRDEMLVRLPGWLPYLEFDDGLEPAWEQAVATTRRLRTLLAGAAEKGAARDEQVLQMTQLTDALRRGPNSLNFRKLVGRRQTGDPADFPRLTALLETPWPTAAERAELWTTRQELSKQLQQKRPGTPPAWDEGRAIAVERRRGLRRARWSVELLELQGAGDLQKVKAALARATETPSDTGRLELLAGELRQAWARQAAGGMPENGGGAR